MLHDLSTGPSGSRSHDTAYVGEGGKCKVRGDRSQEVVRTPQPPWQGGLGGPSVKPNLVRFGRRCIIPPMQDLITDLDTIYKLAQQQEDENIRFRQFVKYTLKWSDRRLDDLVGNIVHQVEAAIDCRACANCCRVLEVSLDTEDLLLLADHLGRPVEEIDADYAARGTLCDCSFAQSPCAFLQEDNLCSIYSARPRDCREYPHLQKGQFRQRMWQALSHAEDCPIVFNTLQQLKRTLVIGPEGDCDAACPDTSSRDLLDSRK